jgi:hypothetical protein
MMWKWHFNLQTKPVMFLTCFHTLFILWTRPLYLMFVPCIIRRSRNDQQYAHICTTALFYIPAPTCFGSSVPSSESFWIHLSYMKIQIGLVVYHITLVKWPVCRSVMVPSVHSAGKHNRRNYNYTPTVSFDLYYSKTSQNHRLSYKPAST